MEDIRLRLRALAGLPSDPDPAVVHSLLLEPSGLVIKSLDIASLLRSIARSGPYPNRLLTRCRRGSSRLVASWNASRP
jgi:hypothetical protein